jgi:glutamate receptor, ionotropic, plant
LHVFLGVWQEIDAAVGDVTIIANRATDVDFTMPYTESGVSMLVLSKNNDKLSMWIFLQPLTNDLWIATTVFIFFTGLVVWMSEFPSNDEFRGSRLRQFSTVFYFIFSTLTFSHGMWSQPSFFFIAFINQKYKTACIYMTLNLSLTI